MITADNITSHEFIGLHTEIAKSSNHKCGIKRKIVDETKSMFKINTTKDKINFKIKNSWKFSVEKKEWLLKEKKLQKDHLTE